MTLKPEDFAELHARYHWVLFHYFLRQTGDPELSGDLLQATFERAIKSGERFHGSTERETRGWLRSIAFHIMEDHVRDTHEDARATQRLDGPCAEFTDEELARLEDTEASAEFFALLTKSFDALPEDQAEAVRLHFVEDLPYEDIAKRMHTSEQVIRARASRGLRTLRGQLKQAHYVWLRSKQ